MTKFEVSPEEMSQKAKGHAEVSAALASLLMWWQTQYSRTGNPFKGGDAASDAYRAKWEPQVEQLAKGLTNAADGTQSFYETQTDHANNYKAVEEDLNLRVKSAERPDVVA